MKAHAHKHVSNRLSRIEGQVRGLRRMIDENEYCIDIINQSSAIRHALSSVEDVMLENHLEEHVVEQMKGRDKQKAIGEIINVFKRSKKK